MSEAIRVLIADDHYVIRTFLSRILESQEDFRIVGQTSDGVATVELTKALRPDVVLMDYDMPGKDGAAATEEILKADPRILVIGFSMHDESTVEKAMLEAGAAIHISKKTSAAELLPAIRKFAGLHS
jgi:DNA-binding NarL/FixJ family response regulator